MTTPNVNVVMPYGVTVQGAGGSQAQIVGNHPMKDTNVALRLTPGPCRVAASWEGNEQVFVRVQNRGKSIDRAVATIRGGGGYTFRHGLRRGHRGRFGVPLRGEINRSYRHYRGVPARHTAVTAGAVV